MPTLGAKSPIYLGLAKLGGEQDQSSALDLYSILGKGQLNPCETTTMSCVMGYSPIVYVQ